MALHNSGIDEGECLEAKWPESQDVPSGLNLTSFIDKEHIQQRQERVRIKP
jgi:hypothetical protein